MSTVDTTIVIIYVLLLFAVGVSVGIRETAEDFLILSRRARFPLVLFSIVSTWVGVGVMVGTAASGYDTGVSLGLIGGLGAIVAVIAAGLFAPTVKRFGDRFHAHTLADFFAIRYSPADRFLVGAIIFVVYLLLTAVQFVGLAALFKVWSGLGFEVAIGLAALTTIVYTAFAGIKSDFYTDGIHFVVMVLVLFGILLPTVLQSIGGWSSLQQLPSSYFDPFAFGGLTFFIGGLLFGAGVVFVSMEIWQRIYASTSPRNARWALIGSAVIIMAFYLLSAFFGMATKIVEPSLSDRDLALFTLMKKLLPEGVLGLGLAAFIATFVSTVNTTMMVVSATLTKDFYKGMINPAASDNQLLTIGRSLTLLIGLLGFGVAFVVRDIVTLSVTALFMLLVLLPAVIGGFFWKKATQKASFYSILLGFIVTLLLIPILQNNAFVPGFVVSLLVFVGMSLLSDHSPGENVVLELAKEQSNQHHGE